MTYEVIGASAKDPNFQNRCRGSAIAMAADILNAVQDSGSIQDSKGGDLTTLASKNLAKNFCKGTHLFTDQALASLILLNYDVAANPMGSSEAAVQYQTKEIWLTLVEIG